jgi:signal transduction histidine kinase
MVLYGFLLGIVRRADAIIQRQQGIITDRTDTLELLSAQLLTAQEQERTRLSVELHEGLVQTLSAAKLRLEDAGLRIRDSAQGELGDSLDTGIEMLQGAMQEILQIAMRLRPPGLDDFGILSTLKWYMREFQGLFSRIRLETEFDIEEDQIPGPLKVVVYRIVEESCYDIAKNTSSDRIRVKLGGPDGGVALTIEDNGGAYHPRGTPRGQTTNREVGLATAQERTALSGGSFSFETNEWGGMTLCASWPPH